MSIDLLQEKILDVITTISGFLWGPFMLILLIGGGLFLSIRLKFIQIRHFKYMMGETFLSVFKKRDVSETMTHGTLTPFQAVTTSLASTVGAANIIGVPVAIYFGGPGAIFWMWLIATIGMVTMYSEVVLGVEFREKNKDGEYVGGPMYYLKNGLKSKVLGNAYAFFFMIQIFSSIMVQSNSAAGSVAELGINKYVSGLIILVIVGVIVVGGVKRIGKISEKFVPIMAGLYLLFGIIIIFSNITAIPNVFMLIFKHAFRPTAAAGGFAGSIVAVTIRWGMTRGTYSNEAGMGSAPIAHATAITDHPARQGLWGMFTTFFDTIVICTVTALVILSTGVWKESGVEASAMPVKVFSDFYGSIGGILVSLSILMFVISTIYVILFYGEKLAEYLFGYKFSRVMRYIYLAACFLGAIGALKFVWSLLDLFLGLTVIPNIIGVLLLSGVVAKRTKEFFETKGKYYLKDIEKN